MKNTSKVLHFPSVAHPNIDTVLAAFLRDQRSRLRPRTLKYYEDVIELLKHCLNSYGANELNNSSDLALYDRLCCLKNLDFCEVFGPDKILPSLSGFLNYFMIRKVMASEALLQAAGTVTKKLVRWLEEKGHLNEREAVEGIRIASEAARELPAAERLARLLYDYAQTHAPRYWTAELDDYFTVEEIKPGELILSGLSSPNTIEIRVSQEITDHCRLGWQINLLLGKTRQGWVIIETGNVYPS